MRKKKKTTFSEFQFEIFRHTLPSSQLPIAIELGNEMRNLPEPWPRLLLYGADSPSDTYPVPGYWQTLKSWGRRSKTRWGWGRRREGWAEQVNSYIERWREEPSSGRQKPVWAYFLYQQRASRKKKSKYINAY